MKKAFRVLWIILGLIIISIILFFVFSFYGNPIGYLKANKNIEEYKSKMNEVDFNQFDESKTKYNFKTNGYYKIYTYKKQNLSNFSIECYKSKCIDNYDFNFIEGVNSLSILGNKIRDEKFSNFENELPDLGILILEPIDTLDNLKDEYKNRFLNDDEAETLPIFKAKFSFMVSSFDDEKIYDNFLRIKKYFDEKNYSPVYYEATIYAFNGNDHIEITKVDNVLLADKSEFYKYINTLEIIIPDSDKN